MTKPSSTAWPVQNMIERIDHVNLIVDDLPTMVAFYQDVLGLRLTKGASIGGDWIEALTGFAKVEADVAYLEAGTGAGVELIEYRTPAGSRPNRLGDPNTKGIRHVAFRVADLDAAVASLQAAGVDFLSDVQQVSAQQVDYADQRKRIVYCRDPEGNLLEICALETEADRC